MADNVKPAGTPQNKPSPVRTTPAGGSAPATPAKTVGAKKAAPLQKPKKKSSGGLVVGLFFIILIAGAAAMVYFDLGGFKDVAVTALRLNAPTSAQLEEAAARERAFADKENALLAAEEEQKAAAKELKQREKDVAAEETDLFQREAAVAQKEAVLNTLSESLNARQIELTAAVEMFSHMDAEKAAKALSGIDEPADIALLLLYMDSEKSALILDNMRASLATKVMTEIINMQKSA